MNWIGPDTGGKVSRGEDVGTEGLTLGVMLGPTVGLTAEPRKA
jgi:hypothetical protein